MAFLGITLKCARCHDHKYDPISQQDYYRVRAFFEPYDVRIDPLPGNTDPEEHGVARVFDANLDAMTYRLIRGDEKNQDKDNPLSPGVPEVLNRNPIEIQPVQSALEAHYPASKTFFQQDLADEAKKNVEKAELAMERARKALDRAQKRAAQVSSSSSSGEASSRPPSPSARSRKPHRQGNRAAVPEELFSLSRFDEQAKWP